MLARPSVSTEDARLAACPLTSPSSDVAAVAGIPASAALARTIPKMRERVRVYLRLAMFVWESMVFTAAALVC